MKTVVTELAFLSLFFGRVVLTVGNRPSFCTLDKETGPCRAAIPRWYYNVNSDKCEKFTYGGCNRNENNFETKDECEGNCSPNTGTEGHPSQLLKLFAKKKARITDRTSLKLRRELNSTLSVNNIDEDEGKNQTISSPSISGTPPSKHTQENSPDLTSKSKSKTNLSSHDESEENNGGSPSQSQDGSNAKTGRSPSQSEGGSNVQTGGSPSQSEDGKNVKTGGSPSQSEDGKNVKTGGSPSQSEDGKNVKTGGSPSQSEDGSNVMEEDLGDTLDTLSDVSHLQNSRKNSAGYPYEHTSSHFAAFFLTSIVMVFAAYVVYHNRQKIIAIVIEGKSDGNSRRRGYRKLETNVEEAMPSLKSSNSTYVY